VNLLEVLDLVQGALSLENYKSINVETYRPSIGGCVTITIKASILDEEEDIT
jgi:hypothetical protein